MQHLRPELGLARRLWVKINNFNDSLASKIYMLNVKAAGSGRRRDFPTVVNLCW